MQFQSFLPGTRLLLSLALLAALLAPASRAKAQDPSQNMATVGGGAMVASTDIMTNLLQSQDHTLFVRGLKATGLDDRLADPGPYTVFAPTDAAFGQMDKDKLEKLFAPENRTQLTQVLNYHIVPGRLTSADIEKMAAAGNGKATLSTVEGDTLTVEKKDGQWWLEDTSHNRAAIQQSDVLQANGVLFVIDTVMQPKA